MLDVPTQEMEKVMGEVSKWKNDAAAKDAELKKMKEEVVVEVRKLQAALEESEAARGEAVRHLADIRNDLDRMEAEKQRAINTLERLEAEDAQAKEEEKANIVVVEHQGGFDHAIRLVKYHFPDFDTSIFDMEIDVHKGQLMKIIDMLDDDE
ncbi:hypothetical protein Fmac_015106 [Flemingia macrophylla]|uniref:Uncharacterized protein n=1 Tax=Flemingia macrophylla TaxID=520843 RepID=A0ABD1MDM2_9FABA